MEKVKKIYIGVAWPYVNDLFHLGNLAGAYLPPDIFSRFHRLEGNEVLMVSGSDFHGTPITLRAEKEKKEPQDIAQKYHELNKKYLEIFSIDYDLYTSTHTKNHERVVQEMFLKLLGRGFIKILKTGQLYSQASEKFLQDRYVEGQCPYCKSQGARGDQCEACGRVLEATELINPVSKIDQSILVEKETENYFLDLKKLEPAIEKWLTSQKNLRSWVKKEALGWVKEGLRPRAITRDLDYGVPLPVKDIPLKKRIEKIEEKVFYVWFEAVIGYLSAAIEYSQKQKKPFYWKRFFYDPDAQTHYFVGQDNLVFHTINWPAQLLAFDERINLPTNVLVNKFLLLEGQKMSKSRHWFIDTQRVVKIYSADSLRFYLGLNLPETKAFSFNWAELVATNNNVLVGTIGNFFHRVLSFAKTHFGSSFDFQDFVLDPKIKTRIQKTFEKTSALLEKGEFRASLKEIVDLASFGNRYFHQSEPWSLIKQDPQGVEKIVKESLVLIDNLRVLLYPFVPGSMDSLCRYLGQPLISFRLGLHQWQCHLPRSLEIASQVLPLFAKINPQMVEFERAKLKSDRSD